MNVPDYSEALTGWRAWRFGPTLRSFTGEEWKPGEAIRAACQTFFLESYTPTGCIETVVAGCERDELPTLSCTCGIYAFKAADPAFSHAAWRFAAPDGASDVVCGSTYLWGRVVEHEEGYRARYAYPKSIVVPDFFRCELERGPRMRADEAAELIADLYGIEVERSRFLRAPATA